VAPAKTGMRRQAAWIAISAGVSVLWLVKDLSTAVKWGISKLDALRDLFNSRAWIPRASNQPDKGPRNPCTIKPLTLAE
jgi:hypothetical protein